MARRTDSISWWLTQLRSSSIFETVELGPVEWDLAHLEPEVAGFYRASSTVGLGLCRMMVSAATSTWCWDGLARGSECTAGLNVTYR
jgi:hypothetical protein